ncbi:hypothetical protein H4582DRAFT_2104804 [Lactarius indigo]|nr:hypothetical protein H4582DRAFT_2104804 [Lactarius indigo]
MGKRGVHVTPSRFSLQYHIIIIAACIASSIFLILLDPISTGSIAHCTKWWSRTSVTIGPTT